MIIIKLKPGVSGLIKMSETHLSFIENETDRQMIWRC